MAHPDGKTIAADDTDSQYGRKKHDQDQERAALLRAGRLVWHDTPVDADLANEWNKNLPDYRVQFFKFPHYCPTFCCIALKTVRLSGAALSVVTDAANSNVPALGYTGA